MHTFTIFQKSLDSIAGFNSIGDSGKSEKMASGFWLTDFYNKECATTLTFETLEDAVGYLARRLAGY